MKSCVCVALLLLLMLVPGIANAEIMKWTVDGLQREALVVPPAKAGSSPAPVILAFHGRGGDMYETSEATRFERYWPEAIVVYMQGLPTDPQDRYGFRGWVFNAEPGGDRDVKYTDAVVATLRDKFSVDSRRIYVTGYSNGGVFTYALWGARGKAFAAFAVVAGRLTPAIHLDNAKPVMVIAGRADRTVRFDDQQEAINSARKINGTSETGEPCGEQCIKYSSSKGTPVVTYIHPEGHVYPGGAPYLTVKFFKDYSLPK